MLLIVQAFFLNKIAKTQQVKNSRISKLKPKTQTKFPKTQRTGTFAQFLPKSQAIGTLDSFSTFTLLVTCDLKNE